MKTLLLIAALLAATPAIAANDAECKTTFEHALQSAKDGAAENEKLAITVLSGDDAVRFRQVLADEMQAEITKFDKLLVVENKDIGMSLVEAFQNDCAVATTIAPADQVHKDIDKALGPES